MPFDLKRADRTYKFYTDSDKTEFLEIKPLGIKDIHMIQMRATDRILQTVPRLKEDGNLDYDRQVVHEANVTNRVKEFNEQIDLQITDWHLDGPDGPIGLNRENKLRMIEVPEFYEFYKDCVKNMNDAEDKARAKTEKK